MRLTEATKYAPATYLHVNPRFELVSDESLKERYDLWKTKADFISKSDAMEVLKKEIAGRIVLKLTTKTKNP